MFSSYSPSPTEGNSLYKVRFRLPYVVHFKVFFPFLLSSVRTFTGAFHMSKLTRLRESLVCRVKAFAS